MHLHGPLARGLTPPLRPCSARQKREEQRPTIDALEGECKEMEGDIDAFNKRQALLRHEMSEMKKENSGIRDRLVRTRCQASRGGRPSLTHLPTRSQAELQFHLLNAKQEKGKLEAQIVRSPDRLKKARAHGHRGQLPTPTPLVS